VEEFSKVNTIEQLTATLKWNSDSLPSTSIYQSYCEMLHQLRSWRLERAIASGIAGANDARHSIEELDELGKNRLTLAPETAHRLLSGDCDERSMQFIWDACEAEHRVAGRVPVGGALWTALGDRYFPGGADVGLSANTGLNSYPGIPYSSPMIGSIVVDFLSPYARGIRGPNGLVADSLPLNQAREILWKLTAANALIEEVNPMISAFLNREITTLVLASAPTLNSMGSSSSPQYIGRAILWNTYLPTVEINDAAEQLLHEAIHCHAYRVELSVPFLIDRPTSAAERVVSPWSGCPLTLYSYVHASFVWYGLTNFWLAALKRKVLPDQNASRHLIQAMRGFKADPKDVLASLRQHISGSVLAALYEMHRSIRELLGAEFRRLEHHAH
jgi:hypothetical protein